MSEKSESAGSNNRWWESYLVRYFLGFIVGTICIAVIAQFAGVIPGFVMLMQAIGGEPKPGVTSIVIAVALLGMAYCYIASTPITVLHAGRYSRGAVDRLSRFFWLGWVCALAFLMVSPPAAALRFDSSGYVYWTVFGISVVIITGWALTRFGVKNGDNNGTGSNVPNAYKKRDYLLVIAFSFAVWSFSQGVPLFFGVHAQTADADSYRWGLLSSGSASCSTSSCSKYTGAKRQTMIFIKSCSLRGS